MSETKFTEGEWEFEQSPEWQIVVVSESGKNTFMCNMTYYPWNSDNIYDWYLIAAAPDMYEELEKAKRSILQVCNDAVKKLRELAPDAGWDDGERTAAIYTRSIDKVLAKARGDHATD